MIYVDSSVILAELLMEDRRPPSTFWDEVLVSSRLLEYEVWNRVHARGLSVARRDDTQRILAQIDLHELEAEYLERALHPFPIAVRTMDSLHLATADYLSRYDRDVRLASYDHRLLAAAQALGIETAPL